MVKIEDFIFHVVHNDGDEPILMEETPIGNFEPFFIDRIREVVEGNKFNFDPDSSFLDEIRVLDKRPHARFLEISKEFAISFHKHDRRISPGVMIFMNVKIDRVRKYVLLKYDHESVVYYVTDEKKHTAILKMLVNTISKHRDALQKSAIIDIDSDPDNPSAIIYDKSKPSHITGFFRDFLGVTRKYSDEVLAEKVLDSFKETVKYFRQDLPTEVRTDITGKFQTAVKNKPEFQPATFLKDTLGGMVTPEMEARFQRELRSNDVAGDSFTFNNQVWAPKRKRYITREGVQLMVPTDADDTVKFTTEGNKTIITITTEEYKEE